MIRNRTHDRIVIGHGFRENQLVVAQQLINRFETLHVHVYIEAAEAVQDEVARRIHALDVERVPFKVADKPGVFPVDQFAYVLLVPEDKFPIRMILFPGVAEASVLFWKLRFSLIPDLMNDVRDTSTFRLMQM